MSANAASDEQSKRNQKASKAEKKRIKKLEAELRRKAYWREHLAAKSKPLVL